MHDKIWNVFTTDRLSPGKFRSDVTVRDGVWEIINEAGVVSIGQSEPHSDVVLKWKGKTCHFIQRKIKNRGELEEVEESLWEKNDEKEKLQNLHRSRMHTVYVYIVWVELIYFFTSQWRYFSRIYDGTWISSRTEQEAWPTSFQR